MDTIENLLLLAIHSVGVVTLLLILVPSHTMSLLGAEYRASWTFRWGAARCILDTTRLQISQIAKAKLLLICWTLAHSSPIGDTVGANLELTDLLVVVLHVY